MSILVRHGLIDVLLRTFVSRGHAPGSNAVKVTIAGDILIILGLMYERLVSYSLRTTYGCTR